MTHALQRNQVVSMNSVLSFRDLRDDCHRLPVSKREHSCVVGNQHEGIFSSSVGNVRKRCSCSQTQHDTVYGDSGRERDKKEQGLERWLRSQQHWQDSGSVASTFMMTPDHLQLLI